MKRNVSLSLDADLLDRTERLRQPGENRSALVERLLQHSVRMVEDAQLDALYDRALAAQPVTEAELNAVRARARAAFRSVHGQPR